MRALPALRALGLLALLGGLLAPSWERVVPAPGRGPPVWARALFQGDPARPGAETERKTRGRRVICRGNDLDSYDAHTGPGSFPFLASIQDRGHHFCAGALIHRRFVLTAASCFRVWNRTAATVVLGAYNVRHRQERFRQTFSIKGISEYRYDPQKKTNDLLLLQLDRDAILSRDVSVVPLPTQNNTLAAGTLCYLAGWGLTRRHYRHSSLPRVTSFAVTRKDQCVPNGPCKGTLTESGGLCQAHGGTPLICNGLVHGVASHSLGSCSKKPNFFTRVALHRAWIDSVLSTPLDEPVGGL